MKRERAKELLRHYFTLACDAGDCELDGDCYVEIDEIVDAIIEAAVAESIQKIGNARSADDAATEAENRAMSGVATCRVCGCTEDEPCENGCWWVEDPEGIGDLCSNCLFELRDKFNEAARDACFRCAENGGLPGPGNCRAEDVCLFWPDRPEAEEEG